MKKQADIEIIDFEGMADDGGTLRIVVHHVEGLNLNDPNSQALDPKPYGGPDDRSAGWHGRALLHMYGSFENVPDYEMIASHPDRATAPLDAIFRWPD
jgi:hypothetical protein